jgi:hypothetical protein
VQIVILANDRLEIDRELAFGDCLVEAQLGEPDHAPEVRIVTRFRRLFLTSISAAGSKPRQPGLAASTIRSAVIRLSAG